MDKSALKDKRRETVIGLLKGMKIKTGHSEGFDKDDVYECIQQLTNLYEDHIDELERNYDAEINDLSKRYQKYDENNELYVSLIMEAKKSSNEIISQAKAEVDEILNNGKEQVALQERELEQFKADSEKKKESIAAELKATKDVAEAEMAAMKVEIEAEKEKLEATKNKYKQQITSMEDEFSEIKTNILRTSARLDSLKAQAEEVVPVIEWEVEPAESVQMPQADVEVDDVVEFAQTPEPTFEETFFKSDVLDEVPKADDLAPGFFEPASVARPEPIVEPAPVVEPEPESVEPSIEQLLADMDSTPEEPVSVTEEAAPTAEKPEDDVEALLNEISFDDILEEEKTTDAPEKTEQPDEINLEELVTLDTVPTTETVTEPVAEHAGVADEISFDSLEAPFKDEK